MHSLSIRYERPSKSITQTQMIQEQLNAIRDILLEVGERVEGNLICDIHPDNLQTHTNQSKINNLQNLVKGRKRVCEVGVNAGHSLLLMLDVNPTAEYVLFDIGIHRYTRPCVEYIQSQFPNTSIRITYGDSKETLPLCNEEFDFIHIDGGHEGPEVISDYTVSIRLIAPNCPVVFNDYNYSFIQTFLNQKFQCGEIALYKNEDIDTTNQHIVFTPLKETRKKRLAFYTCFLGGDSNWANVIPQVPSEIDDCYYFTNNQNMYQRLESTNWIRIWLDIPIENDNVRDAMNTKHLRCCPREYTVLRNYEYSCWIDSKFEVTDIQKVYEMVDSLTDSKVIAITRHPVEHKDVWGEYMLAIQYSKYYAQKEQYQIYIHKRLQEGFDKNKPLRHCTGFIVRKQCPKTDAIGRLWYSHIQECGIECQISWQFICQLFEDSIVDFEPKYCWRPI
jgi:hypothetical protein